MKRITLIGLLTLTVLLLRAQSLENFIRYLEHLPATSRQEAVDSFLIANPGSPLIEHDTVCNFICQASASEISVAGDMTGWKPGMILMKRIDGTDLWYGKASFPPDARLDYKYVIDTLWTMDPRNPYSSKTGFGVNSELRMPRYRPAPESVYDSMTPRGTIMDTVFYSMIMENLRTVRIYLPVGYSRTVRPYPVILFHDGSEFITLGDATVILDNLISVHRIRPVIGIFVEPIARDLEYSGALKDSYVSFIMRELMPVIDTKYNTSSNAANRATVGISNGGNAALYLGCSHPESFARIAAYSSNVIPQVTAALSTPRNMDLVFYIDIGRYDIDALIPMAENLVSLLKKKGYPYSYYRWNDGHSWANWRDHLGVSLEQFFPPDK
jgi:enterochelin esterase-like enzyme